MLPGPTTPERPRPRRALAAPLPLALEAFWRRALGLLLTAVLGLGLVACAAVGQPSQTVLLSALALQIDLTQRSIASALELAAAGTPQVSRVRVESQETIAIGDGKGLHLSGRFDWRLAGDPIRVDSAFDLYLQRGERGQSWRLARPIGAGQGSARGSGSGSGSSGGTSATGGDTGPGASHQEWLIDPLPLRGDPA